jgi:hypothetical protein
MVCQNANDKIEKSFTIFADTVHKKSTSESRLNLGTAISDVHSYRTPRVYHNQCHIANSKSSNAKPKNKQKTPRLNQELVTKQVLG